MIRRQESVPPARATAGVAGDKAAADARSPAAIPPARPNGDAGRGVGDADTVWRATATNPAPPLAALDGDIECDVAVIGAGFTGLSTAHHLLKAGVRPVVVIEARGLGFGASGRTAGMAGTRYKHPFAAFARRHGPAHALRLHAMAQEAIDTLEGIVGEHRIPDAFSRYGQLIPAHAAAPLAVLEEDVRWLAAEAGDGAPRILTADETRRETGSDAYVGAWFDPRGGAIHPLNYVHGLAAALVRRGVPIHVESPVTAVAEEPDAVVLTTPRGGRVQARQAVVATNAYTDMALRLGDLHRRMVAVSASIVATEPLSDDVAAGIMPGRRVASDTRRLLHAFRMLPDNRLLFAGRADITGRRAHDPASYAALEAAMAATFPQVERSRVRHRWSGLVGMSADGLPHLGRLSPRVLYAVGFSGRGVTLTSLLGRYAARMACGEAVDAGPITAGPFRPIPLHGLRVPMMRLVAAWYGLRDALAR